MLAETHFYAGLQTSPVTSNEWKALQFKARKPRLGRLHPLEGTEPRVTEPQQVPEGRRHTPLSLGPTLKGILSRHLQHHNKNDNHSCRQARRALGTSCQCRGQQTFFQGPESKQTLDLAVSVPTTQLHALAQKQPQKTGTSKRGCVPIKLYSQRRGRQALAGQSASSPDLWLSN